MSTTKEAEIHENPVALDSKRDTDNGNELQLLSVKQDPGMVRMIVFCLHCNKKNCTWVCHILLLVML